MAQSRLDVVFRSVGAGAVASDVARLQGALKAAGITAAAAFAGGAVVAGLRKISSEFRAVVDEAGRLSDEASRIGTSIKNVVILGNAFAKAGMSAESLGDTLNRMQRSLDEASEGSGNVAKAFGSLGLSIRELRQLAPDQQLQRIGEALTRIEDPARRVRVAMEIFGRGGGRMLTLFGDAGAIADAQKAAGGLADVMERNADQWDRISDRLGTDLPMKALEAWAGFFDAIGSDRLLRGLDLIARTNFAKLGADVASVAKWAASAASEFGKWGSALGVVVPVLGQVATVIRGTEGAFQAAGALLGRYVEAGGSPGRDLGTGEIGIVKPGQRTAQEAALQNELDAMAALLAKSGGPQFRSGVGLRNFPLVLRDEERAFLSAEEAAREEAEAIAYGTEIIERRKAATEAMNQAQEIALQTTLSQIQQRRSLIESDRLLTDQQRREGVLAMLEEERAKLLEVLGMWERRRSQITETGPAGELARANIDSQMAGVRGQLGALEAQRIGLAQEAYLETPMGQLREWAVSFGTTSQQIGQALTQNIGTAVNGISNGISNLVLGTGTWADAMRNAASAIIQDLIRMAVQMAVVKLLLMAIPGFGQAGAVAGMVPIPGFASGGLIPGTPSDRDNRLAMVATGEHVTNARAVSYYGAGILDAFNRMAIPREAALAAFGSYSGPVARSASLGFASGGLVGAGALTGGISVSAAPVNVAILNTRAEMRDWAQSAEGKRVVFDAVSKRTMELGMRG